MNYTFYYGFCCRSDRNYSVTFFKIITQVLQAADDDATLQAMSLSERDEKPKLMPRWPTRVFVSEIVQKLMTVCDSERAHLDLSLAKELQVSVVRMTKFIIFISLELLFLPA